jgi:hypothetical protein
MDMNLNREVPRAGQAAHRRAIRVFAAVLTAATATLYFLIGLGVLKVVEVARPDQDLFTFGAAAGAAYVLGALLLFALDNRVLWVLGAILQVIVIVMYVGVSSQRTPPFEVWGLLIKVLQAGTLVALGYLAMHAAEPGIRLPAGLRSRIGR